MRALIRPSPVADRMPLQRTSRTERDTIVRIARAAAAVVELRNSATLLN